MLFLFYYFILASLTSWDIIIAPPNLNIYFYVLVSDTDSQTSQDEDEEEEEEVEVAKTKVEKTPQRTRVSSRTPKRRR